MMNARCASSAKASFVGNTIFNTLRPLSILIVFPIATNNTTPSLLKTNSEFRTIFQKRFNLLWRHASDIFLWFLSSTWITWFLFFFWVRVCVLATATARFFLYLPIIYIQIPITNIARSKSFDLSQFFVILNLTLWR